LGEISIQNVTAALGALNSGIRGILCTLHAESPYQALNRKFSQNAAWSGQPMADIPEYLHELVDLVVQIKRDPAGKRQITDLYLPKQDTYLLKDQNWKGAKT